MRNNEPLQIKVYMMKRFALWGDVRPLSLTLAVVGEAWSTRSGQYVNEKTKGFGGLIFVM